MLTYQELLKNRRSIRDYKDKNITMETIKEILSDACLAPSACNVQPWRFIVINNQSMMKKISDESKKNLIADIEANPNSPMQRFEETLKKTNYNIFYNAPCLVIIAGKNDYQWLYQDCSLCATYLMLAATARGLGTCWIGLGQHIKDKKLKEEIGLPDDHEIVASIILGYPKNIPEPSSRNAPIILKTIIENKT